MKRVSHRQKLPLPHPPTHLDVEDESEKEAAIEAQNEEQDDPTFEANDPFCERHLFTQRNINYLGRDLDLSKYD